VDSKLSKLLNIKSELKMRDRSISMSPKAERRDAVEGEVINENDELKEQHPEKADSEIEMLGRAQTYEDEIYNLRKKLNGIKQTQIENFGK
jgi:hypothetical protein